MGVGDCGCVQDVLSMVPLQDIVCMNGVGIAAASFWSSTGCLHQLQPKLVHTDGFTTFLIPFVVAFDKPDHSAR